MNLLEHQLTILAEECAEVAQRVSKALRFGLLEVQPGQTRDNAQRICEEFTDLVAAYEVLVDENPRVPLPLRSHIEAKKRKMAEFREYSRRCGTLTEVRA